MPEGSLECVCGGGEVNQDGSSKERFEHFREGPVK